MRQSNTRVIHCPSILKEGNNFQRNVIKGSCATQGMVGPVAFPLAKLAVVTVRQAGRPLARMVERLANRSSAFRFSVKISKVSGAPLLWAETFATDKQIRRMVCLPLAQFYHYYEVKMRLAALNLGVGKVLLQVENVIVGLFTELLGR